MQAHKRAALLDSPPMMVFVPTLCHALVVKGGEAMVSSSTLSAMPSSGLFASILLGCSAAGLAAAGGCARRSVQWGLRDS